ncbi:MAG TPA: hypothetical protein VGP72_14890 [Planctomycetota bacterium]|jgi:hypothetical protein
MKPSNTLLRTIAIVCLAVASLSVRAERDYEFAVALMDRDEPSFPTDDLVEHLAAQLEQKPETKMDAKLIRATLRMRQARDASVEKRKTLLDEAEALYREILTGPKTYKHYDIAERESATINSKRVAAMIKSAQQLDKTNPAAAKKLRQEAAETRSKIAAGHKAESDKNYGPFKDVYAKYKKWNEKENATGEKPIPPDLLKPLATTFDAWWLSEREYIVAKIEQLDCYDDADAARKTEGDAVIKLLKAYLEGTPKEYETQYEALSNFPVITAWCNYMLGRAFAALQNESDAGKAWQEALAVETNEMAPPQKKAIFTIKKSILHDLIKMKMRAKKYSDVEGTIVEARLDPGLRTLFEEDAGKDLMIDYAKALTLPADSSSAEYEKAIKELRKLIQNESKGGQPTRWANEYSRTIAELIEDARQKGKPRPKLTANEWYDAAHGFFLIGQQEYLKYNEAKDDPAKKKAQFEKMYDAYQNAVDYFHRTIAEARKAKTDLYTRVEVEPKAWSEMALGYLKMEHYYEAIIAYQAMRDSYLPDNRKKWMPDLKKPEYIPVQKKITEQLADLDKPDGLNVKSGKNIVFALDKNIEAHKSPNDLWNKRLKPKIMGTETIAVDDKNVNDPQYQLAKVDMEEAKSLVDSGKLSKDAKQAEDLFGQGEAKYLSAGAKFIAVKPASPAHELAMYQAGSAYTMAQSLWAMGRFKKPAADVFAKCKEYGKKAVEAFDKYDQALKTKPAEADEDKDRRRKLEGTVLLARNALHSGACEWEPVIKTADEYLAWEGKQENLAKSERDVALLNKFRAQIELASANWVPKCDQYLDGAEVTMKAWREIKTKENKIYVFMLNALSRRNLMASFQIDKFVKDGKKMEDGNSFTLDMMDKYENKVADLQAKRVEMMEENDENPTLEDYSRLVYLFNKTRRDKPCADTAKELLSKFDPKDTNCRIKDDEKLWKDYLVKMKTTIRYADLNKMDRCKKDHAVLIDYMYDTAAGLNATSPDKRPEDDKYNSDMEKARNQIETIRKNYPDCQTITDKTWQLQDNELVKATGGNGNSLLGIIEDEVDFRRKIIATREMLFSKALKVAADDEKKGMADDAKKYKEIALPQLKILTEYKGSTPELMALQADLSISVGKLDEALETVNKIRVETDSESIAYFDASRKASEILAMRKKYREAAEYPEFLALTIGFDARRVKERWPDMKIFLKECYDNGATMPDQLKKAFAEGAGQPEPKKEEPGVKPEEKKEPGAEEKKPEAKPEEKKPAEVKPDEKKPDAKPEEKKP